MYFLFFAPHILFVYVSAGPVSRFSASQDLTFAGILYSAVLFLFMNVTSHFKETPKWTSVIVKTIELEIPYNRKFSVGANFGCTKLDEHTRDRAIIFNTILWLRLWSLDCMNLIYSSKYRFHCVLSFDTKKCCYESYLKN